MSSIIKNNNVQIKNNDIERNGIIKSYKENAGNIKIKTKEDKIKENKTFTKNENEKFSNYKEKVIDTKKELLSNSSKRKRNKKNEKEEIDDKDKKEKNKNKQKGKFSKRISENLTSELENTMFEDDDLGIETVIKTKQGISNAMIINEKAFEMNKIISSKVYSVATSDNAKEFYKNAINNTKKILKNKSVSYLKKKQKNEIVKKARKKTQEEVIRGIKTLGTGIKNFFLNLFTKKIAIIILIIIIIIVTIISSIIGIASIFAYSTEFTLDDNQSLVDKYLKEKDDEINQEIDNIEKNYQGYDKYIYNVPKKADTNRECVYAFLKAKYEDGELSDEIIKLEIDNLHRNLYKLDIVPSTTTENIIENGNIVIKTINILTINFTSKTFEEYYEENKDVLLNAEQQENYKNILSILKENAGKPLSNPFPPVNWEDYITSEFGYRNNPTGAGSNFHTGLDLGLPYGTDIHACISGIAEVINLGDSSYGLYVTITNGNYKTIYAHCSSVVIESGKKVNAGDIIAKVGSTGNSTGSHLHLEYRINEEYKNPKIYLKKVR